jgi:hypothetical protein
MPAVHHTGSAVMPYFLKQIYVAEWNYRKVCLEGKYLCGMNAFQLTRRSAGSGLMDIGDALELPARNHKVLCLGEKGARISACVLSDAVSE